MGVFKKSKPECFLPLHTGLREGSADDEASSSEDEASSDFSDEALGKAFAYAQQSLASHSAAASSSAAPLDDSQARDTVEQAFPSLEGSLTAPSSDPYFCMGDQSPEDVDL